MPKPVITTVHLMDAEENTLFTYGTTFMTPSEICQVQKKPGRFVTVEGRSVFIRFLSFDMTVED